ncbi:hypothetical protein F5144DRAFT_235485 [Chaetomium tenue]|uniref:Uncharacterized protein n=1 Tax=Chaetomium tenue TaxID=1854479 RepID=A0ACB7PAP6_9PEZI|nr:hypothetical protein F5144DRAFT_235485 [Chaetomium globosum]
MKRILVIGETTNSLAGSGEYQCPSSSCDVEDPWSQGRIKVAVGLWQLPDNCSTADGSRSMTTSSNPMRRQDICTSAAWTGEWSHMPCRTQALGSRSMQLRNMFFQEPLMDIQGAKINDGMSCATAEHDPPGTNALECPGNWPREDAGRSVNTPQGIRLARSGPPWATHKSAPRARACEKSRIPGQRTSLANCQLSSGELNAYTVQLYNCRQFTTTALFL